MNPKNKKLFRRYIAFMIGFPFVIAFAGSYMNVATFIYVAVMFGVPIYYAYRRFTRLQKEGISAVATITDILKTTDSDGEVSYRYCYEFTVQGKVYTIKTHLSDLVQKYKTGDKVKVLYMPDNPQQAEIEEGRVFKRKITSMSICLWVLTGGIPVIAFVAMVFPDSRYILEGTLWIYGGAAVEVLVGYDFWRLFRLRIQGRSATATVTGYTQHVDSDNGNLSYFPNFEFYAEGKTCTLKSSVSNVKYNTGDRVNIHYNPDDPESADIDNNFKLGLMFILTCVFFLVMVVGVLFFVFQAESFGEVYSKVSDLFF